MRFKRWLAGLGVGAVVLVGGAWMLLRRHNGIPPPMPRCAAPALSRRHFGPSAQLTARDSPGRYQFEPSAALIPSGELATVFIANTTMFSRNRIGAAIVPREGGAGSIRPLPTAKEQHFDPWLAVDRKGRLYAVWLGFDRGLPERRMQIALSTSDDGGRTWNEPRSVQDPKDCPAGAHGCMDKPMVAVGPDRDDPSREALYVFYFSEVAGATRAVRSVDGGRTFAPAVDAADGVYGNVQVGPSGTIHLAYMTADEQIERYGDPKSRVEYARSDDGGRHFSKGVRVSAPGQAIPFFFSNPQVVADEARGLLYVAYPSGTADGRWDVFLATSKDGGKSWTRVKVNDDAPCASHMVPNAALDPRTGDVHLIWLENRSGEGGLAYAVCATGGVACGPNEAVNDKPFASYGMERHDPTWLGEYNTLLLDPARRELHAVWSQTVDDGDGPRSRVFHARAALVP